MRVDRDATPDEGFVATLRHAQQASGAELWASNASADGRQQNRRTEIVLIRASDQP